MKDKTPTQESEELVDNVVDNGRTQIIQQNEQLIQEIVTQLGDKQTRKINAVFSEARRRVRNQR